MKPPTSVLLLSDSHDPQVRSEVERLATWLRARSVQVEQGGCADQSPVTAGLDLVVVLGGDGTFLQATRRLGERSVPFLGIRFGTFGYLTELEPESWEPELERLFRGEGRVESWLRLRCRMRSEEGTWMPLGPATNEVLVTADSVAQLMDVLVSIDGEPISRYRGDGLILATPAGSTAHSLAAGGPILEPTSRSFLLTPLASQALTWRPLVLRPERRVEILLAGSRPAAVILDGRPAARLTGKALVEVCADERDLLVASIVRRSRFRTLRERLRWGEPLALRPHRGEGDEGS